MLFNSFVFVWFFLITYSAYLLLARNYRAQNVLLLVASYMFYGWWDWRFLFLMLFSSLVDFYVGARIARSSDRQTRKRWLLVAVLTHSTVLGFFKYFNFFMDSAVRALGAFGWQLDPVTLNIVLPVGISFYTFQALTYSVDIYRRELEPSRSLLDYLLYVAYFPQLVAGPIERAAHLLPQISRPRTIRVEQVNAGLFFLALGYFKKVVVADNMGLIAKQVFDGYQQFHGLDLMIGVAAFAIQIYGDFSGYSDIARGLAKLMGFELMVNFNLPYFALSPRDFWRCWHISLSTWLRDYLYIPLGGSRGRFWRTTCTLMLTMLLGGLWHGAAWHFVLWGGYHGLLLILYRVFDRDPDHLTLFSKERHPAYLAAKWLVMLVLTGIGWVLFRASSLEQIGYIFTHWGLEPSVNSFALGYPLLFFTAPLALIEWWQCTKNDQLALNNVPIWWRAPLFAAALTWMCVFGVRESLEFIYFQF